MARDCWKDANRLAELYSKSLKHDFWILHAVKPHTQMHYAMVAGWEVIAKRPPRAMVGVLVFKWSHNDRQLTVEADLSLPYDIPISDSEMSTSEKDYVPTVEQAAKKSGSILLA